MCLRFIQKLILCVIYNNKVSRGIVQSNHRDEPSFLTHSSHDNPIEVHNNSIIIHSLSFSATVFARERDNQEKEKSGLPGYSA